jgi:hypothetical protein
MKQLLRGCRFRWSFDKVAADERRAGADECGGVVARFNDAA